MKREENVSIPKFHPGVKVFKGYSVKMKTRKPGMGEHYIVPWELIESEQVKVKY